MIRQGEHQEGRKTNNGKLLVCDLWCCRCVQIARGCVLGFPQTSRDGVFINHGGKWRIQKWKWWSPICLAKIKTSIYDVGDLKQVIVDVKYESKTKSQRMKQQLLIYKVEKKFLVTMNWSVEIYFSEICYDVAYVSAWFFTTNTY